MLTDAGRAVLAPPVVVFKLTTLQLARATRGEMLTLGRVPDGASVQLTRLVYPGDYDPVAEHSEAIHVDYLQGRPAEVAQAGRLVSVRFAQPIPCFEGDAIDSSACIPHRDEYAYPWACVRPVTASQLRVRARRRTLANHLCATKARYADARRNRAWDLATKNIDLIPHIELEPIKFDLQDYFLQPIIDPVFKPPEAPRFDVPAPAVFVWPDLNEPPTSGRAILARYHAQRDTVGQHIARERARIDAQLEQAAARIYETGRLLEQSRKVGKTMHALAMEAAARTTRWLRVPVVQVQAVLENGTNLPFKKAREAARVMTAVQDCNECAAVNKTPTGVTVCARHRLEAVKTVGIR